MKRKQLYFPLIIFTLALIIRLVKLKTFTYFSGDEELIGFILRRMSIGHLPVLTSPSATLGLSLGAFFHWIILPFFILVKNQYQYLFLLGPILGAITTTTLYLITSKMWNRRIGIITSLIYAGSFFVILFDQRFWVHSINPLLSILNLFALFKLIKGHYRYAILLVFTLIFGWHSDPALLALSVSSLLTFLYFRLPLLKKKYYPALILLLLSISPLILFDLRHEAVNSKRFVQLIQRPLEKSSPPSGDYLPAPQVLLTGLSHLIYTPPADNIKLHFSYSHNLNQWGPASVFISIGLIIILINFLINLSRYKKTADFLIFFQLVSILGGLLIYHYFFIGSVFQFYLTGIFPVVAIILALFINKFSSKLIYFLISVWLLINFNSFIKSNSLTTLSQKLQISQWIIDQVDGQPYQLQVQGKGFAQGGGWTYLLTQLGHRPEKSYLDPVIGWLYLSSSSVESFSQTVIIADRGLKLNLDQTADCSLKTKSAGNIKVYFSKCP